MKRSRSRSQSRESSKRLKTQYHWVMPQVPQLDLQAYQEAYPILVEMEPNQFYYCEPVPTRLTTAAVAGLDVIGNTPIDEVDFYERVSSWAQKSGGPPEVIDLTRDTPDTVSSPKRESSPENVTSESSASSTYSVSGAGYKIVHDHQGREVIDLTAESDGDEPSGSSSSQSPPHFPPRPSSPTTNHHQYYTAMENGEDGEYLNPRQPASGGIQAWDSCQNLPVNTVDDSDSTATVKGVEHYLRVIAGKKYMNIQTDFTAYRNGGVNPSTVPSLDNDHSEPYADVGLGALDPKYDGTTAPEPKDQEDYLAPIYITQAYNPLLPLAIIRVAEKNLPFMDFTSALNHLPNLGPTEPFPTLPTGLAALNRPGNKSDHTFLGDIPYEVKNTDVEMTIVFLPEFYADGRHCVGFKTSEGDSSDAETMLYTPCTQSDLQQMGLLRISHGPKSRYHRKEDDGEAALDWKDICVGAGRGDWVSEDVEEEEEVWDSWHWFVVQIWGRRLRGCMGTAAGYGH